MGSNGVVEAVVAVVELVFRGYFDFAPKLAPADVDVVAVSRRVFVRGEGAEGVFLHVESE